MNVGKLLKVIEHKRSTRVEQLSPTVPSGSDQLPSLIATQSTSNRPRHTTQQRGLSHAGPVRGDLSFSAIGLGASAPS